MCPPNPGWRLAFTVREKACTLCSSACGFLSLVSGLQASVLAATHQTDGVRHDACQALCKL